MFFFFLTKNDEFTYIFHKALDVCKFILPYRFAKTLFSEAYGQYSFFESDVIDADFYVIDPELKYTTLAVYNREMSKCPLCEAGLANRSFCRPSYESALDALIEQAGIPIEVIDKK